MQTAPHQQSFVAHPLAQLAGAFAAGILGAHFFSAPVFLLLLVCLLTSLLALICLFKQKPALATALRNNRFSAGRHLSGLDGEKKC